MVSTRVCGTLSLGSNPSRHPKIKTPERGCFYFGVTKQANYLACVWDLKDFSFSGVNQSEKYLTM